MPSWVWIAGLLAFGALAWSMLRRQTPSAPMAMPMGGATVGYPAAGGSFGYGAMPPQQGSGMLGVGLAAAGGVAAGMLAERLLEGDHHDTVTAAPAPLNPDGLVPGMFDDAGTPSSAAYELESQQIDFGSGADWGGDAGDIGSADW